MSVLFFNYRERYEILRVAASHPVLRDLSNVTIRPPRYHYGDLAKDFVYTEIKMLINRRDEKGSMSQD